MRMKIALLFIFYWAWLVGPVVAQDSTSIQLETMNLADFVAERSASLLVGEIIITGNKKTKDFIVLRELPFKKDGRIAVNELDKQLQLARQQLMNTLLFVDVTVKVGARKGNVLLIQVDLKERWYLFPLPYFRLIDRNFNQWWVEQKRSLERVNYGVKFIQNNVSGRNDNLDIWLINGYTQQVTLRYDLPFADRKLKSGFNIGLIYASQKELNYATGNNKQLFFKQEQIVRRNTRFDFTYSYRPDVKNRHYFRVSYNHDRVADSVLKINPLYFPGGSTSLKFIDFSYQYKFYNVDYIAYPSTGVLFESVLYKRGLTKATNLWVGSARMVYAIPFNPKTFLHLEGIAQVKLPFNNFFYNERLIGYGFFQMRGLEYNVVDGMAGGIFKTTLHQRLFQFILRNPFPSKTHDRIPIRFFLKAYGDLGYAHNKQPQPSNTLNNRVLRTWGLGMDIVSIYDFVFKIEYSFNQLGRDGLYLQSRNDF